MQRNIVIPVLFHHFIISIGATVTDLVADNNNTVVSQRFYVVKKTGFRYVHNILTRLQVSNRMECAFQCTSAKCTNFNYRHVTQSSTDTWNCEIIGNKPDIDSTVHFLERNFEYMFYEAIETKCLNGGQCEASSSSSFRCNCVCPCLFVGARCEKYKAFKSCKEVLQCGSKDGEYYLQLQSPTCNKSVRVYCADMDTTDPKEYVTLRSGEDENFSHVNNTMSPQDINHFGSTTKYSRIRLTTDLQVIVADHRFARITWNDTTTQFLQYGEAGDCISRNCTFSKFGNFKMDIRHTGLNFVTPFNWDQHGWPSTCGQHQPLNYVISDEKQVVSGNCGARCGGCRVKDLHLKIEEC